MEKRQAAKEIIFFAKKAKIEEQGDHFISVPIMKSVRKSPRGKHVRRPFSPSLVEARTVIPNGPGKQLGSYEGLESLFESHVQDAAVIVNLHMLLFGKMGQNSRRKANIRMFTGEDATKLTERIISNHFWTSEAIDALCDIFGISLHGADLKSQKIVRLANFLACPTDASRATPPPPALTIPITRAHEEDLPLSMLLEEQKTRKHKRGEEEEPKTAYQLFLRVREAEMRREGHLLSKEDFKRVIRQQWDELLPMSKEEFALAGSPKRKRGRTVG